MREEVDYIKLNDEQVKRNPQPLHSYFHQIPNHTMKCLHLPNQVIKCFIEIQIMGKEAIVIII